MPWRRFSPFASTTSSATNFGTLDASHLAQAQAKTKELNEDGFRIVAVAYKEMPGGENGVSVADESDLTLLGYIAFLDPPKETAGPAIRALNKSGVAVKILTGDNEVITRKICREVGLDVDRIVLGPEIEKLSDAELAELAPTIVVFAKVSPAQKARVIAALHAKGHVVGYVGDGINDAPALRAADVGISVDTAVDIAKEAADIILLEKSLMVLEEGVIEGRKVFANIVKYVRMGASSNFGNMFSVLGASLWLPYPADVAHKDFDQQSALRLFASGDPHRRCRSRLCRHATPMGHRKHIRFMLFIGPISSIFDYTTFITCFTSSMHGIIPSLFQTGWFVESLLTQTLIIHVIRTAKDSVPAEPRQRAADHHVTAHLRGGHRVAKYSVDARSLAFHRIATALLGFHWRVPSVLRSPDAHREKLVCPALGNVKAGPARQVAETTRASLSLTAFTNVSSATSSGGITLSPVRTRPGRAD